MKFIGNLLWLIFGGLLSAILWTICGLLMGITIIGIPFGLQALKLAGFTLWPFGREVVIGNFGIGGAIGNVIWIMLFGWELAVYHALLALLFTITIIGFPFGKQHIKLARLSLIPFGADIHTV
ncbi:MAG: YccF domain-containing protein [Spirochaetes bacterium]|nr:MAG: YccF domain-containing protein [Spirochaetota bacterium]